MSALTRQQHRNVLQLSIWCPSISWAFHYPMPLLVADPQSIISAHTVGYQSSERRDDPLSLHRRDGMTGYCVIFQPDIRRQQFLWVINPSLLVSRLRYVLIAKSMNRSTSSAVDMNPKDTRTAPTAPVNR